MEALSIHIVSSIAYLPFLFRKCLTSLILFGNYFMFLVVRWPLPVTAEALVNYLLHCSPYLAHCLALRIFSINVFDEWTGSAEVPLLLSVHGDWSKFHSPVTRRCMDSMLSEVTSSYMICMLLVLYQVLSSSAPQFTAQIWIHSS